MSETIAVIGLGYVGLPVALAFAKKFETVGFDIDAAKVKELVGGYDRNHEVEESVLKGTKLQMTADTAKLAKVTFWVIAVPTPVDENNVPDLTPVVKASETVGKHLKKGDVVVYESTVYPGVTEDICGPVLVEGLRPLPQDFKLGYSPERINPGDKEHTLERITKVVSAARTKSTLERVASTYGAIIDAGVHRAPSIKVAEAAKVIENTQRDINIALVNELALIFDRIGVRTADVLAAAGTKWNFLKFRPGLVGGHCIGVDPYYLTSMAQRVGYHSEVILAGRRINDNMGRYVAQRTVKQLVNANVPGERRACRRARPHVQGRRQRHPQQQGSRPSSTSSASSGFTTLLHDPYANAEETPARVRPRAQRDPRGVPGPRRDRLRSLVTRPISRWAPSRSLRCLRDGGGVHGREEHAWIPPSWARRENA